MLVKWRMAFVGRYLSARYIEYNMHRCVRNLLNSWMILICRKWNSFFLRKAVKNQLSLRLLQSSCCNKIYRFAFLTLIKWLSTMQSMNIFFDCPHLQFIFINKLFVSFANAEQPSFNTQRYLFARISFHLFYLIGMEWTPFLEKWVGKRNFDVSQRVK